MVVDRFDVEGTERVMVAERCRADHPDSLVPGELDQDGAHSSVGAQRRDGSTRTDPSDIMQHLPGGDPVDQQGLDGGGIQVLGGGTGVRGRDRGSGTDLQAGGLDRPGEDDFDRGGRRAGRGVGGRRGSRMWMNGCLLT